MVKNYLRITFRNLFGNKEHALINIFGLTVGITVCLLTFLVIRFVSSFDNFHHNRDHIYRVVSVFKTPNGLNYEPGVSFPTGPTLRQEYGDMVKVASILSLGGNGQINVLNNLNDASVAQKFKEESGILYAEPEFFDLFDFKWLSGDKAAALKEPNTVVLTRSVAEKYFGNWQSAVGRLLKLDNTYTLRVSGILENPPANTDFPLKVVISYITLRTTPLNSRLTDWSSIFAQHYCFVSLDKNVSENQFNKRLDDIVQRYKPIENRNEGMMLLPLKDMHFDTRYNTFNNHPFSKNLILALSLIGLFVLVIACVNFVNLATAQAINRSKEVGVRKVLGSSRAQLLIQFVGETGMLVFFATLFAVIVCELTLPFVNRLLDTAIGHDFIAAPEVILMLIAIIIGTTFLAGFYPAVVLSGFKPIAAIRNKVNVKSSGANMLRRVLVVLQFTISQALIICVLIIIGQMDYFRSSPMGFNKEAIVVTRIPGDSAGISRIDVLGNQLRQMSGVQKVSFSYGSPVDNNDWNSDIKFNHIQQNNLGVNLKWADVDYPQTYGLKLLAGRFYFASDTVKDLVVNETFLKKVGISDPQKAIGAIVEIPGEGKTGTISGVVKDFNVASLHSQLYPVILGTWKQTYQTVNIKVDPSKLSNVLPKIERTWKETYPDYVYEYRFLDESIASYYKQEQQLSTLYKIFACVAIFISCLGLYSLVSFVVVQRAKEVGIRKALGASASHIVFLFSKEFTILIVVAFFISVPIAWYFMHRWLENYAFHITPGVGLFVLAIVISMFIAWASVGYKAVKAALVNPLKNLKEN
ncbi:ABC transporter permease [Chitinophaga sp. RAB17]|uniref:ABC transporter permease n=1 Tax=Chitinophaga sp. RAB17 TaxID=3233049 RepID=UPI003F91388E